MRIKNFIVSVAVYQLAILVSVVYAAFLVRLVEKIVILEGWLFIVVSGTLFVVLLIFNVVHGAQGLRRHILGINSDNKDIPSGVIYFDIVLGSSFLTFIAMLFVDQFFVLVGRSYLIVAAIIFLSLCVFLKIRSKSTSVF